jgi:integrase
MVDKHYSKYSPLLNAEMHSARNIRNESKSTPKTGAQSVVDIAFAMLADAQLDENGLVAALGVGREGYVVTEETALKALSAKRDEQISNETLLKILNG